MPIIAKTEGGDRTRTDKLESKLLGPWIGELESACGTSQVSPDHVRLDLVGVTFLDADGRDSSRP